jgi:putative oxidoreductase
MWKLNLGLFLLRLLPSSMLIIGHGWPKMMQFSQLQGQFPNPIGLGSTVSLILTIIVEVFCPLFIILGLATRINSILVFMLFVIAGFLVHGQDPWNAKELALMYSIPFLVLSLTGAGSYSIDEKKGIIF